MTFSIPIPKSPLVDKQGIISRDWFVFLSNLLTAVGNGSVGSTNEVLHGGALGFSQVVLSQDVIGTLPITNGGTGATTSTGALANLGISLPLTVTLGGTGLTTLTANNVILGNGTATPSFVAPGSAGNVLTSDGSTWSSSPTSSVSSTGIDKFYVNFNGTGTPTARVSFNLSSIGDDGVGEYTLNFTISFSTSDYVPRFGIEYQATTTRGGNYAMVKYDGSSGVPPAASALAIVTAFGASAAANGGFFDASFIYVSIVGEQ